MSRFGELLKPLFLNTPGKGRGRIFVVSAYSGITNLLLEHKKTGRDGVYQLFKKQSSDWQSALDGVLQEMLKINRSFESIGLPQDEAEAAITARIDGIKSCLYDLQRLCSYGHFRMEDQLPAVRELLASVGEFHAGWNAVAILTHHGAPAVFADLTGWMSHEALPIDEKIAEVFRKIDIPRQLVIATGYTKCSEGLMKTFDRGYSEITFSKIATVTRAREGIIHKEYHLSSADPLLVGVDKVRPISAMSFDMADQLADLGMEAIHPKASKGMEMLAIPIRVKNAFAPADPGTLITGDYRSKKPEIVMICGREDLLALEITDPEMVGQFGYDHQVVGHLTNHQISYIAKNTNANTITHYVADRSGDFKALRQDLQAAFPRATLAFKEVAIVSVVGGRLSDSGILARACTALFEAGIPILAVNQCMRQVNLQFIIERGLFRRAVNKLHDLVG